MSVFDRMWETLGYRSDAPALPGAPALPDGGELIHPPVLRSFPTTTLEQRHDSIANPLTNIGNAWVDKGAAARPNPYVVPLNDDELQALHDFNGIASRILRLPPERATAKGWTAPDIGLSEDKRLQSWSNVCLGMIRARTFGDAPMVMVTEDDVPAAFRRRPQEWLAQPLDLNRVGKLRALQVFDAFEAAPRELDRDITSTNYRSPRLWSISSLGYTATVHASRVIFFRGTRRASSAFGSSWVGGNRMPDASVLQVVYDEIMRLTQTMQGGATLAQELRQKVLKLGNLASIATGDQKGLLTTQLSLMARIKSMLGIVAIGPGDEYTNQSNPPAGFKDLSDAQQEMLCLVLGWPRTMLNGEAPGALGSGDEGGLERERQIINAFQEAHRHLLEQLYTVVYSAQDGPTGGIVPDEWELTFYPLNEPKEKEVAEVRKLVAETDAINIGAGVYGPEEPAKSRYGTDGFQMELQPVPIPDPEDDAAMREAVAAELVAASGAPGASGTEEERADASDGCCILIPAADPGLRSKVEAAIGQRLTIEDQPHVTILYLGSVSPSDIAEVIALTAEEVRGAESSTVERGMVRAFPPGPDGVPVIVEFSEAWALQRLHDRLLQRLAHLVAVRQHARYRAHQTLGYARAPLSPEAATALLGVSAEGVRVPVAEVRVMVGREVVATVQVGG